MNVKSGCGEIAGKMQFGSGFSELECGVVGCEGQFNKGCGGGCDSVGCENKAKQALRARI